MNSQAWKEVFLGDVANEVTVGFVGSMTSEYVDEGIPFLRSKNIDPYKLKWNDIKYIGREFHEKLKKSALSPGDVVIVRTGNPGTAAIIPKDLPEANCADLVIVRPGPQINKEFLVYYLNSVASHHVSAHLVGAVQQHFNVSAAKSICINLPPIEEQKAIATVLSSLDDKIDLLHRQNKTLEAMAETLFRQWFLEASTTSEPERKFGELVKHLKINVKPSEKPDTEYTHYSLPSFDEGMRAPLELGSSILSNKYGVEPWTILVSKLNPRFPRIWPIGDAPGENPVCSTEFQVFKPIDHDHFGYLFYFLRSKDAIEELSMAASGTSGSHQRVRPEDILNLTLPFSTEHQVSDFSKLVMPGLLKSMSNLNQVKILESLRDTLLPKLMSGEVRVAF